MTDLNIDPRTILREATAFGADYTPDELDDLTSRKVESVPFSGDDLARIVRARRGVARVLDRREDDAYADTLAASEFALWGNNAGFDGNRRMAAVGGTLVTDELYRRNPDGSIVAL